GWGRGSPASPARARRSRRRSDPGGSGRAPARNSRGRASPPAPARARRRAAARPRAAPGPAASPAVLLQDLLQPLARHRDLHTGSLLLEQHEAARVAIAPATVERLGDLLEREVAEPHRHAVLAAQRGGERDVLVAEAQGEGWRLELPGQELLGEHV